MKLDFRPETHLVALVTEKITFLPALHEGVRTHQRTCLKAGKSSGSKKNAIVLGAADFDLGTSLLGLNLDFIEGASARMLPTPILGGWYHATTV